MVDDRQSGVSRANIILQHLFQRLGELWMSTEQHRRRIKRMIHLLARLPQHPIVIGNICGSSTASLRLHHVDTGQHWMDQTYTQQYIIYKTAVRSDNPNLDSIATPLSCLVIILSLESCHGALLQLQVKPDKVEFNQNFS